MVIGQVSNRTISRGKNHESCNDHLQRDRYAVGSTANRGAKPHPCPQESNFVRAPSQMRLKVPSP
jgi:hypothetical protein